MHLVQGDGKSQEDTARETVSTTHDSASIVTQTRQDRELSGHVGTMLCIL